jgi:hypothetical protein
LPFALMELTIRYKNLYRLLGVAHSPITCRRHGNPQTQRERPYFPGP